MIRSILLIAAAALSLQTSLYAATTVYNISLAAYHFTTSASATLEGTIEINNEPVIGSLPSLAGSVSTSPVFSLEGLTLSNSDIAQTWTAAELVGYGFAIDDSSSPSELLLGFAIPVPGPLLGVAAPLEAIVAFGWTDSFGVFPSIGAEVDVSDIPLLLLDEGSALDGGAGGIGSAPLNIVMLEEIGSIGFTSFVAIPEPATPALILAASTFLLGRRRKRQGKR